MRYQLTRGRVREKIKNCGLLKRVIADLKDLFLGEGEEVIEGLPADELIWIDENGGLWDKDGVLPLNVQVGYNHRLYICCLITEE